ncbi:MAG: hypothetical protein AAGA47_10770 [Pseudomonadota bacterium]
MVRLLCVLLLCTPTTAFAGAWPRAQGEGFVSTTFEFAESDKTITFYGEWGWSETVTIGFDAYVKEDADEATLLFFARRQLGQSGPHVWALGGGVGVTARRHAPFYFSSDEDRVRGAFLRLSAHYGLGLPNGWFAVDASYDFGREVYWSDGSSEGVTRRKLDATYGHKLMDAVAAIGQVHTYDDTRSEAIKLVLGLAWTPGGKAGRTTYESALQRDIENDENAIKIGLWRRF